MDTREGSLYSQLEKVLSLMRMENPMYILCEYFDSPKEIGSQIDHVMGYMRIIKYLQKSTWHLLMVATGPALALEGDTEATHMVNGFNRQNRNNLLELVCRAQAVPCWNVPLQFGTIEGVPNHTTRNPNWGFEPLSTPSGNITREYLRRLLLEFTHLIPQVAHCPVRRPNHEGYDEQEN